MGYEFSPVDKPIPTPMYMLSQEDVETRSWMMECLYVQRAVRWPPKKARLLGLLDPQVGEWIDAACGSTRWRE